MTMQIKRINANFSITGMVNRISQDITADITVQISTTWARHTHKWVLCTEIFMLVRQVHADKEI